MLRLTLPIAGGLVFFALSVVTVRVARPRTPRNVFLLYALVSLIATAAVYTALWPLRRADDALGLVACLLAQALACLTVWNTFYSVLWGFSGGLCHDLLRDPQLRQTDRLVRSYEGDGGLDRIMARRLPNLVKGQYLELRDDTLILRPKGRAIARGTRAAFRIFSLGMGGGV